MNCGNCGNEFPEDVDYYVDFTKIVRKENWYRNLIFCPDRENRNYTYTRFSIECGSRYFYPAQRVKWVSGKNNLCEPKNSDTLSPQKTKFLYFSSEAYYQSDTIGVNNHCQLPTGDMLMSEKNIHLPDEWTRHLWWKTQMIRGGLRFAMGGS